jgi:hypothetical protein
MIMDNGYNASEKQVNNEIDLMKFFILKPEIDEWSFCRLHKHADRKDHGRIKCPSE